MWDVVGAWAAASVAVLAYLNSLDGEFLFDDLGIINAVRFEKHTKTGGGLAGLWHGRHWTRPLLYWTYARDVLAHGYRARGWHATHLAIHAVNAAAVFAVLRYWFPGPSALMGAGLFSVYPLGVASVASISGRSSLLSMMFYLFAIIAILAGLWPAAIPAIWAGFRAREDILLFIPSLLAIGCLLALGAIR